MRMRIGNGFDAHKFKRGVPLVLGGVSVPYEHGLEAHSDGDVVIHALCDALLGTVAAGDIGQHFPDTDKQFASIDSRVLLRSVIKILSDKHAQLENADITIIAQAPRLAPYIISMRENLAADLDVHIDQISIKATTTEGMGFVGRKEGIAALASVLVSLK
jgi:2-C-methyl-D-erythritol 2,4-cyclodiphosphate synthase